jgi:flagellar M-ring protein FliF
MAVVRPMLRRILAAEKERRAHAGALPAIADGALSMAAVTRDNATAKMLQIAKVNGEIQAEALDSLGEMVRGHPQETVAVLRSWLHD